MKYVLAAVLCGAGAVVAWISEPKEAGFWRGWWIGTRWAYVVGGTAFLIVGALSE